METDGIRYAILMGGIIYDSYGSEKVMNENLEILKATYKQNGWDTKELTTKEIEA